MKWIVYTPIITYVLAAREYMPLANAPAADSGTYKKRKKCLNLDVSTIPCVVFDPKRLKGATACGGGGRRSCSPAVPLVSKPSLERIDWYRDTEQPLPLRFEPLPSSCVRWSVKDTDRASAVVNAITRTFWEPGDCGSIDMPSGAASPEPQHRAPVATVHNMVCTSVVVGNSMPIDLQRLCSLLPCSSYNRRRFAAMTIRVGDPKCTGLLFTSGKLVVTGAKSW